MDYTVIDTISQYKALLKLPVGEMRETYTREEMAGSLKGIWNAMRSWKIEKALWCTRLCHLRVHHL